MSVSDKPPIKIKPTNDVFMTSLWCDPDNKFILLSFLNCILTVLRLPKILDLVWLDREKSSKKYKAKRTIADVLVRDEKG